MNKTKVAEFYRKMSIEYEENELFYFRCDLEEAVCEVHSYQNLYVKLEIIEVHQELKTQISQVAKSKGLRVDWVSAVKFKLSEEEQ